MSIVSPNYRAVIFDLDGTLLDTIDDIAIAMNRVLEGRGFPTYGIADYKLLVGDGIEEMVRRALAPRPVSEEETAGIVRDYRREYDLAWRNHSRPYPGIPELLGELEERGVRMAILSNKSDLFTRAMTAELLAGIRFDSVRGASPGIPLKPDPAPALLVAGELAFPPASIIFLGDTKVDMLTARAAGMFPAGALWGFRSAAELSENGAAALLSSPLELLAYFGAG